jgi:hypothetical protein
MVLITCKSKILNRIILLIIAGFIYVYFYNASLHLANRKKTAITHTHTTIFKDQLHSQILLVLIDRLYYYKHLYISYIFVLCSI